MTNDYRKRLGELLRSKSLVYGELTLTSGQKSNYYFDCKMTTLDPEGAFLSGHAILDLLDSMGVKADAIGGLTMGADPVVSAAVVVSHLRQKPISGFLVRKEHKKHGRGKQIEGIGKPPLKVVIVDEICTTGKSTQEAIDAVVAEGYEVVAVISLLDREEGGSEKLRQRYNYRSVFTARELMDGNRQSTEAAGSPS